MNELVRHFFLGFFSSELAPSQDSFRRLITGVLVCVAGAGLLLPITLYRKFFELAILDDPNPFRQAMHADLCFLLSLTMLVMAMVALLEWTELFPDRRDWLILGPLPITRARLFSAKLVALTQFAILFTLFLVVLPSVTAPVMMIGWKGRWQSTIGPQFIAAYFLSAFSACIFVFFGATTLQGILLHLTPTRWWPRVSLTLQSTLLIGALVLIPFVIEIPGLAPRYREFEALARWLPSVWFLEALEGIAGRAPVYDRWLMIPGFAGVLLFPLTTVLLYWAAYRRGAEWLLAPPGNNARPGRFGVMSWLADLLFRKPGPRAIAAFTAKTLWRSRTHKLLFAGYAGLGLALVIDGFLGLELAQHLRNAAARDQRWLQARLAIPLVLLFFILSGLRHIFAIPVELRAQWLFRLTEDRHRSAWLDTTERFLILVAVVPASVFALITTASLGPVVATFHCITVAVLGMLLLEIMLFHWDQVPFACGYRPDDRQLSQTLVAYWIGFSLFAYLSTRIEAWALSSPGRFLALYTVLLFCYGLLRFLRRQEWGELPLRFSGEEEPVVQCLGLSGD